MALKGKTAIISGATRGIGKAIALELAKEGVAVSFNYLKSSAEAKALETELAALGVTAKGFPADIKDYAAVQGWIGQTRELFGGLDIVVNNAGVIRDKALAFMVEDDWKEVLNTNLCGTINLSRAAIVTFFKQRSGTIVNMTSISGMIGIARQTNYAASKAGIIGFTRSLAKETAGYNIRVNAIAPGFIETEMLKDLKEEYKLQMLGHIPLGRFGKTEEVAKMVRFLADDECSGYINGQTFVIDGGLSLAM